MHSRAEEIFFAAIERDAAERRAFVAHACGDDAELRIEVESLLAADASADGFLDTPIVRRQEKTDSISTPAAQESPEFSTRAVGPYVLQKVLGVGGMGTVYLAERQDGEYEKQVAVKLISRGLESNELLERFHNERQVLANLDHPGIARLLDGGTTEEGFPYLVMEYVDGEPIDTYCNKNNLSIRKRLELFQQVCESVSYAHRHLVIHRDLKPNNILVNKDGRVILLDFGIAKISDPSPGPLSREAVTQARMATPLYASPESMRGEPVTTTSDVYSLGVTLYKLLTSSSPYKVTTGSMGEMLSLLQTSQPVRPSDVPGIDPGLTRALKGDLDRVVLMALRKEPERRYVTVEMFSDDLHRYLRDLPVRAQVDSLRYRSSKFVQRNRLAIFMAGSFVLLLMAATILSFALYRRAETARAQSVLAQQEAEANAATANQVTSFLTELFNSADPANTRGADLTARDLIDLGARRVREDLGEEPAVQSRVMKTIGEVYNSLGLPDSAEALLVEAVKTAKQAHGEVHPDVASALRAYGDHLLDLSQFELAQAQYNEALMVLEQLHGTESIHLAPLINRMAQSDPSLSHEEKVAMFQRSLAIVESERQPDDPLVAYYLVNLAHAYRSHGDYEEAMPLLQRAIAIREAKLEADDPIIAQSLGALGALLTAMGRYEEAIPYLQRSIALLEQVYGEDHPQVTPPMNTLGTIYFRLGQYDKAAELYERCRATNSKTFGDDNMRVGFDNIGLGDVHLAMQRLERATQCYTRASEIFLARYGPQHVNNAYAYTGLGKVAAAHGDHQEAVRQFETSLELLESGLGANHSHVAETLEPLAASLNVLGRESEAAATLQRAHEIRTR